MKLSDKGWIKLHRKVLDCWIWKYKPYDKARAWIDLLLLSSHKDTKIILDGKPFVVSRGSFFTSVPKLCDRWEWSRNKVLSFLCMLEKEQMINTKRFNKGTVITIVKYEDYQSDGVTEGVAESTTQGVTEGVAEGIQNKNVKNVKNINNNIMSISTINALFEQLWLLYPRKKGKGQISDAKKRKIAEVGKEQMIRAIERYKRYVSTQKDLSYQYGSTFFNSGYIDYLDENYVEKEEVPKNTNRKSFNNFESRSYDMDDLERQLLGKG